VTGKEELVSVYEVFDGDPPELIEQKTRTREAFEKGVYEYHAGNFTTAYELFGSIREDRKPDKPLDIYSQRCRRSMKLGTVENMLAGSEDVEGLA
jgi:hypothetical protein